MTQFLATRVNRAHLTRQGCHLTRRGSPTPGSPLPLEPDFSLSETGASLRTDLDELFEALPIGLGLATPDEDGLNEILAEGSTDRHTDWSPDGSEDSDAPALQVLTAGAATDAVHDYLKQIARVAPLTAEQEVELAKRIETGLFAQEKLKTLGRIDLELKGELWSIAQDGKNAKDQLLEANLGLVVPWARRYSGRGMLFVDLIQEGNLGLIRAVEGFDYTKGLKFSTYAMWWIRKALTGAMADQARTIRIPMHIIRVINKLAEYERWTEAHEHRLPTVAEIARQLDLTPQSVVEIQNYRRHPVSVHELIPIAWDEIDSTSELTDSGWATELRHLIEDSDSVPPGDAVNLTLLHEHLHFVLDTLSEREAGVVSMRYGLTGGNPKTFDEIGKVYGGQTREQSANVHSWTISKLRHPSRSKGLRGYLGI